MDVETARLIGSLHRQDVLEIEGSEASNAFGGALEAWKEEIGAWETFQVDQAMARSIAQAVLADARVIHNLQAEEELVLADRSIALELGGLEAGHGQAVQDKAEVAADAASLIRYVSLNTTQDDLACFLEQLDVENPYSSDDDGEPSTSRAREKGRARDNHKLTQKRDCTVCHETCHFFDILPIPCGHEYCRNCLEQLYTTTLSDESLFPVRCCNQEIPLEEVSPFLTGALFEKFKIKAIEYGTVDRTYCSNSACARFIPPTEIADDVAVCTKCHTRTCSMCKHGAHLGDCPADTALQQLLDVAHDFGWQRCYACRRMVELAQGCNHMTYGLTCFR